MNTYLLAFQLGRATLVTLLTLILGNQVICELPMKYSRVFSSLSNSEEQRLSSPMTFSDHYLCEGSGCPYFILAEGTITADTPRRLSEFIKTIQPSKPVIYFHSPGGNLAAGIELGRIIRSLDLDTYVGGPYTSVIVKDNRITGAVTLVDRGICFSACSYAFLGGTTRLVGEKGAYGVHQFYGNSGDTGEAYTQVTLAILAKYIDEMGVDRRLLDIASLTPSKNMQTITQKIAQELNIDNTNPPLTDWKIDVTQSGKLYGIVTQLVPRKNAIVSIVLTKKGAQFVGTVWFSIKQRFRSVDDLEEIFSTAQIPKLYRKDKEPKTISEIAKILEGVKYETNFPIKMVQP